MDTIVEFFLAPYHNSPWLYIILEFIAAVFGVISVFYAKKENILVFPTGIISTGLYVFLLSRWQLYGDLIINIYYTAMSIYGWWMWLRIVDNDNTHIKITSAGTADYLKTFGIFVFTSVFVITVYRYYGVMPREFGFAESLNYVRENIMAGSVEKFRLITPYIDTFTTGAAFAAMWLMANKKLQSWTLWIVVNVFSIPLYFIKGYGFTGIQYFIFLVLAVLGYREWKKVLTARKGKDL
jgi:nicotinamide mononucleotide transporter